MNKFKVGRTYKLCANGGEHVTHSCKVINRTESCYPNAVMVTMEVKHSGTKYLQTYRVYDLSFGSNNESIILDVKKPCTIVTPDNSLNKGNLLMRPLAEVRCNEILYTFLWKLKYTTMYTTDMYPMMLTYILSNQTYCTVDTAFDGIDLDIHKVHNLLSRCKECYYNDFNFVEPEYMEIFCDDTLLLQMIHGATFYNKYCRNHKKVSFGGDFDKVYNEIYNDYVTRQLAKIS